MIHYIKQDRFEKAFPRWAKGQCPDPADLEVRIMGGIERTARVIARCLIAGETPARQSRHIKRIVADATEASLWRKYVETFQIGPVQQQGTLVAVSNNWPGLTDEERKAAA